MIIEEDISLKHFNTFGVDVRAKFLITLKTFEDARRIFKINELADEKHIVIGGGSNVLFTDDFDGVIIKNEIQHFELCEDGDNVIVEAGGGNDWDSLVKRCVDENLWGIENLSLIPGSVGAAPIQNIGAYGVELKNTFESLEAVNTFTAKPTTFSVEECIFGYRSSVFKKRLKNQFLISKVRLKLSKIPAPTLTYKPLVEYFKNRGEAKPSLLDIREAVIAIRKSKIPDPKKLNNAGSFFKNPILPKTYFDKVRKRFPEIISFPVDDNYVKVSAGWLIESCGLKGFRLGNVGTHKDQALVIVNYGSASGLEILNFARFLAESVYKKFKIKIKPEVNIFL